MEIRYIDKNDDPFEISDIYEQSWKYAYKGIIPQEYLDSITLQDILNHNSGLDGNDYCI